MLQVTLTNSITALALLFVVITMIDFTDGLLSLWQAAGAKPQLQAEWSRKFAEPLPCDMELAIAPQVEPVSLLPDPWAMPVEERAIALPSEQPIVKQHLLLPPTRVQTATLEWIKRNMPPAEIYVSELPDAIALAKVRQPKAAPIVKIATKEQLLAVGIRKCKRLASQIGVRGYSNLKLSQLVERLEGRVLQSQLVA